MVLSGNKSLLICQLVEKPKIKNCEKAFIAGSLLTCLNEATKKDYELIVIIFSTRTISLRNRIFQLCECLKNNPLTRNTPILASIEMLHRDIVFKMQKVGVDFMKISREVIDCRILIRAVQKKEALFRSDWILANLCPFMYYSPIDDRCELITCRARKNRMVLGGKRLQEICETTDHLYCEYYQNPGMTYDIS
jgi:hypothetical protein